jgi:outer membrane receptor protein involved in Fe transport
MRSTIVCACALAGAVLVRPLAAHEPSPSVFEMKELSVVGGRPFTAASSLEVRDRDLVLRPIRRPGDLLEVAPGLVVIQHAGGGKANQYTLRGFDADHGTDVAIDFDGVPVNNPTHGHGQGYADVHFVIPELVERVVVDKGPYFVEHGNFATAGAIDFRTRRVVEDSSFTLSIGRFDVYRALAVGGARLGELDVVLAAEGYSQDGPFENEEDHSRYNVFARVGREAGTAHHELTLTSYRGTWNASGQLPLREVRAGRLDRFGTLDPAEGGNSHRHQLYGRSHWTPDPETETELLVYGVAYDLDLFSNFTFFARDPANGDQIGQNDTRWLGGLDARHTRRFDVGGSPTAATAAIGTRADRIRNGLDFTRSRLRLSPRTSHRATVANPFGWLRADTSWNPWLRTVLGLRVDGLVYDVTNRLEQSTAEDLRGEGTESDAVVGPKASIVLTPLAGWSFFLNYGQGYHANDARGAVRDVDPVDPAAEAIGWEVGLRTRVLERVDVAAAFWVLDLESEIVFVGDEGTTEASGKTRRFGGEVEVRAEILDGLFFDLDLTRAEASFRNQPDDADEVPLAPRWTLAGGLSMRREDGFHGSLRTRGISSRPAVEDGSIRAQGYFVWDLQLGRTFALPLAWTGGALRTIDVRIDLLNLFDREYREAQFATASRLPFEDQAVEEIHFTPGYPITVIGSLTAAF